MRPRADVLNCLRLLFYQGRDNLNLPSRARTVSILAHPQPESESRLGVGVTRLRDIGSRLNQRVDCSCATRVSADHVAVLGLTNNRRLNITSTFSTTIRYHVPQSSHWQACVRPRFWYHDLRKQIRPTAINYNLQRLRAVPIVCTPTMLGL